MEEVRWIPFPNARLAVHGLPWTEAGSQRLRRLPARAEGLVPTQVWDLAQFPGGGRVRFRSDTGQVRVRYTGTRPRPARITSGLDVYVDGVYWNSAATAAETQVEQTLFAGAGPGCREVEIYLPLHQTLELHAIGIDAAATLETPRGFAQGPPLVLYGSSIAQGVGAGRPAMSYQAILARRLDLDFVNLGFGGAGKAEPEVVQLVADLKACCFVFDLGKSYGRQGAAPYAAMLETVRRAHPATPLICITPIFSTREQYEADYRELSEHVRAATREVVTSLQEAGDANVHLVEGLELLGPDHADEFVEGVHPSDLGCWRIASRLEGVMAPLFQ